MRWQCNVTDDDDFSWHVQPEISCCSDARPCRAALAQCLYRAVEHLSDAADGLRSLAGRVRSDARRAACEPRRARLDADLHAR